VSTAVINEVLEEAVSRHSPQPLAKDVRENLLWYQVSQPPTIVCNDAKRFNNDNYRRYIERQFRQQLGFYWYPICFGGVKPISSGANRATRLIVMDLLRSLPLGCTSNNRSLGCIGSTRDWLMSFRAPILANSVWRVLVVVLLILITLTAAIYGYGGSNMAIDAVVFLSAGAVSPDGLGVGRLPDKRLPPTSDYQYVIFQQGPVTITPLSNAGGAF